MKSEKEELSPSSSDGAATKKKKKKKPKDGSQSPSTPTKKKKKKKKSSSVTADGDPSAKRPKSPKSPKTKEGSSTPTKKKKKKTSETSKTSSVKKERKISSKSRIADTGRDIEEAAEAAPEAVDNDNTKSTIPLAEAVGERQADLCCDSCCDVRKATLICDIIYIVVMLTLLFFYSAGISDVNGTFVGDDDFEVYAMNTLSGLLIGLVVKNVIGILLSGFSIFGALKYKKWFVLTTGIWILIDVVANFFFMPWFIRIGIISYSTRSRMLAGIVLLVFSYPHFALFRALHKGKITAENYHVTEEYCCCSPKKKSK